jgi:hypothetical protein
LGIGVADSSSLEMKREPLVRRMIAYPVSAADDELTIVFIGISMAYALEQTGSITTLPQRFNGRKFNRIVHNSKHLCFSIDLRRL